ncbi:hypothetical protein M9978_14830 [Sphingomonas sp. MG17]|uniref:PsiF repeat-containing protein n=2 Tax=Sphingomonas tagetis TaxID=2949092 RepID=A0A9X2HTL1_9SPHN|nr:hypothetical protein [Sphingomonas tagetis]
MIVMSMLMAAGLAATPALAQDAPQGKAKDPTKLVCKKVAPVGTRMGKRDCRTQQEWDKQGEAARRGHSEGERNVTRFDNSSPAF